MWSRLTREECDKNSFSGFKRCLKNRDLTNVISGGNVKTVSYAIVELITWAISFFSF